MRIIKQGDLNTAILETRKEVLGNNTSYNKKMLPEEAEYVKKYDCNNLNTE